MIEIVATPKLEYKIILSDGTIIVREKIEDVLTHLRNKIQGEKNVITHYLDEIERISAELNGIQKDFDELKAYETRV
jgi:hypothetical protein